MHKFGPSALARLSSSLIIVALPALVLTGCYGLQKATNATTISASATTGSATPGLDAFRLTVYPMVRQNCAACHDPTANSSLVSFASASLGQAFVAAQTKVDLVAPELSRLV